MKSLSLENVTVLGLLSHRLLRSSMRLESDIYIPDRVCRLDSGGWPADAEGRTLLALIRQMEVTKREPSYLRETLRTVYGNLNEKGYLGEILPPGCFNEQQLSGHNWLLRALLDYARLTGCGEARAAAGRLVRSLYLPLRGGAYARYPLRPEDRVFEGRPDGELTGDCINGWYLSTDIGCAYMCLDGLSRAYRDLDIPELKDLLEEMIEAFAAIDFVGISMQTHATLSGIRGILCFYEALGDARYLEMAKRLFSLYERQGMTENYANQNWFRRPHWTEPCAIVDSFMAAMDLFRFTENIIYFETAQKIYWNALGHAQRENGGFGCDSCALGDNPFLYATGTGGDAYWCCSMRGGEGLAEVARSIGMEKNGVVHIGLYNPAELRFPGGRLEIRTQYPLEGRVSCRLYGRLPQDRIALFIPSYAADYHLKVNGSAVECRRVNGFAATTVPENGFVELEFGIPLLAEPGKLAASRERMTISHGFQMLGVSCEEECSIEPSALRMTEPGVYEGGGVVLRPISDSYRLDAASLAARKLQILFRRGEGRPV